MDLGHPDIRAALAAEVENMRIAHMDDSTLMVRLFDRIARIRDLASKITTKDYGSLVAEEECVLMDLHANHLITDSARNMCWNLLHGIEEATTENNEPIYAIPFPSRPEGPKPAA